MNSFNQFSGLPEFAYGTRDTRDEVESNLDSE